MFYARCFYDLSRLGVLFSQGYVKDLSGLLPGTG